MAPNIIVINGEIKRFNERERAKQMKLTSIKE